MRSLVLVLAACAGTPEPAGPDADADTDTDTDTDSDTDTDTDSDTDTDPTNDADGDGWTVSQDCDDTDPAVVGLVTVDGAPHADLGSALAAAVEGSTIAVCRGVHEGPFVAEVPVHLVSTFGAEATTLTGGADRVLSVPGGSTVTGFTLRDGRTNAAGGGLLLTSPGSLAVDGCVIAGNEAEKGGGVAVAEGSVVTMSGTTIHDNFASFGGGLWIPTGAAVTLVDTEISANEASRAGGGVQLDDATLIGGSVARNRAESIDYSGIEQGGGGVAMSGVARIEQTRIHENSAAVGGGLSVMPRSDIVLVDVTVEANRTVPFLLSTGLGGGIFALRSTLVLEGTTEVTANESLEGAGGGLFLLEGALTGGLYTENTASMGGGIWAAAARIEDVEVIGNTGLATPLFDGYAGGMALQGPTEVIGSTISGNTADASGGIDIEAGEVTIRDSVISGNVAATVGGGVTSLADLLRLERCAVTDNVAETGAGVYQSGSRVEIVDSTVLRNSASLLGGGVMQGEGTLVSEVSDWGTGADDNSPDDLWVGDTSSSEYGADTTFTSSDGDGGDPHDR